MKKIIMTGTGPLLEAGVRMIGGQCLRTWHFSRPLLEDGFEICLYTIPIPDKSQLPDKDTPLIETRRMGDFQYNAFTINDPQRIIPVLEEAIEREKPDLLIGVNTLPAYMLSAARSTLPLWADLNGWHLVEGHVHAIRQESDDFLRIFWNQERVVVRRADKFSTVSERQRLALLGELAFCGRLGHRAAGYEFAHTVPNAVNETLFSDDENSADGGEPELRGASIPEDAFIALWSGGYNAWTDVQYLYDGLNGAMAESPNIHFVSTGGAIEGFDERTYDEFCALVEKSPYHDRFHLLGWIDAERLPCLYREADVGLNIDAPNYETLFGGRNRLTNMMARGLCPATTLGSEIAAEIRDNDLGLTFSSNDADEFSAALLQAAADRNRLTEWGERSRRYALKHYSYEATTQPIREWAAAAANAPDNAEKIQRAPENSAALTKITINDVDAFMARPLDADVRQLMQDSADLKALRSKSLFKFYKFLKGK